MTQKQPNPDEKIAEKYLCTQYSIVALQLNDPPDYLVDNKIAIEVRRLNQKRNRNGTLEGIEDLYHSLKGRFKSLLNSFGPSTEKNWYVGYSYSGLIPDLKIVISKVSEILHNNLSNPHHAEKHFKPFNDSNFQLDIYPCSIPQKNLYTPMGLMDLDAGGFLISEIIENTKHAIDTKSEKVEAKLNNYEEWQLVLINHIDNHLTTSDIADLKEYLAAIDKKVWSKVIILNPKDSSKIVEF